MVGYIKNPSPIGLTSAQFGTYLAYNTLKPNKKDIMKQAIITIIVFTLSIIVWLLWGGRSNDMGTLIIAIADVFILTAIADNSPKKSEKKMK